MKIEVASLSIIGRVRQKNEDACGHFEPRDEKEQQEKGWLFLVADGMGGHRGGEIASELAVEAIRSYYYSTNGGDRAGVLKAALNDANRQIYDKSATDLTLAGMGTTCTAVAVHAGNAYFAHVGDSRAYVFRDGNLEQITRDHSLVGEMVRSGIISDEDARNHPKRNVITRSLGVQETITADTPRSPFELRADDALVLCTDGLTAYVGDQELANALTTTGPSAACTSLVNAANERGGKDNITLMVARVCEI